MINNIEPGKRNIPENKSNPGDDNKNTEVSNSFRFYAAAVALLAVICIIVFTGIARVVPVSGPAPNDIPVIQAIRADISPSATEVVKAVTFCGSATAMIAIAVMVTFYLRIREFNPLESFLPAISITGAWLLNEFLKQQFHRLRPEDLPLAIETSYSFPSGHAMISLAFYGMLAYLIWTNVKSAKIRWLSVVALAALILAIGLSRIYLGVHYPSDVLAGFAAGGLWLMTCIAGYRTSPGFFTKISQ